MSITYTRSHFYVFYVYGTLFHLMIWTYCACSVLLLSLILYWLLSASEESKPHKSPLDPPLDVFNMPSNNCQSRVPYGDIRVTYVATIQRVMLRRHILLFRLVISEWGHE